MDNAYLWVALVVIVAVIIINDIVHRKDVKDDRMIYAPEETVKRYLSILTLCMMAVIILAYSVSGILMCLTMMFIAIVTSIRMYRMMLKRKSYRNTPQ
jgi:hypothetical protein